MDEKKLLKIVLGLLIAMFLHNIYLNYQLYQVKLSVDKAKRFASSAEDYAHEAANNSETAAEYASEAAKYAEDASDAAFGNNCNYCP